MTLSFSSQPQTTNHQPQTISVVLRLYIAATTEFYSGCLKWRRLRFSLDCLIVKTNRPMNPNAIFGLSSVLCFGLPILVIVLFRLYRHTSLIALAAYYGLTIVHCLYAENIPPVPDFKNPVDVLYSYLEVPLILSSLLFFCGSTVCSRKMIRFASMVTSRLSFTIRS